MKVPGPDHPITVTDAPERWRVRYANHVIADSADALLLKEADYPPVVYFPREDVSMEYLARTDHRPGSHPHPAGTLRWLLVGGGVFLVLTSMAIRDGWGPYWVLGITRSYRPPGRHFLYRRGTVSVLWL